MAATAKPKPQKPRASSAAKGERAPEAQLASFIDKYPPEIAAQTRAILTKMRALLPGALELVYDNYNALAVGFSPTESARQVIFSIAIYPRWLNLFFMNAVKTKLPDPDKLLQGKGTMVRHILLESPATLDRRAIKALMKDAMKRADPPLDPKQPYRLIIKSISANQRPRRPSDAPTPKKSAPRSKSAKR